MNIAPGTPGTMLFGEERIAGTVVRTSKHTITFRDNLTGIPKTFIQKGNEWRLKSMPHAPLRLVFA